MLRNIERVTFHMEQKITYKRKFSIVSRPINAQKSLKAFLICPHLFLSQTHFWPREDTNFWALCIIDSQCSSGMKKLSNNPYFFLPRMLKNNKAQKWQNLPILSFRDYDTRWKPRSLSSCINTLSLPKYRTNLSIQKLKKKKSQLWFIP